MARSGPRGARGAGVDDDVVRVVTEVAHDLRSPLTAVVGNAQLLRAALGPQAGAEIHELLDALCEGASRAVDFTRDLMAAVGPGAPVDPERGGEDVFQIVRACCDQFRSRARTRRIRLDLEVGSAGQASGWRTDGVSLARILDNLIGNAIRYAEGGRIHVAARIADGRIGVAVSDSGPGIESERLADLFRPFVRGPDSDGHGLGLAIARRLVESLGGHIRVTSAVGAGSCFRFTLPLQPA